MQRGDAVTGLWLRWLGRAVLLLVVFVVGVGVGWQSKTVVSSREEARAKAKQMQVRDAIDQQHADANRGEPKKLRIP